MLGCSGARALGCRVQGLRAEPMSTCSLSAFLRSLPALEWIDMYIGMRIDMRADMCIDMSTNMRADMCVDMYVGMSVDMCVEICVDMFLACLGAREVLGVEADVASLCIDLCETMCVDMCIDLCVDMCVDMGADMCEDMRIDMCEDMCVDM